MFRFHLPHGTLQLCLLCLIEQNSASWEPKWCCEPNLQHHHCQPDQAASSGSAQSHSTQQARLCYSYPFGLVTQQAAVVYSWHSSAKNNGMHYIGHILFIQCIAFLCIVYFDVAAEKTYTTGLSYACHISHAEVYIHTLIYK